MARHPDKARENRARRAALRQGLALLKSPRRDPLALDYGGYMLADARDRDYRRIVFGDSDDGVMFSASLDDVEARLRSGAGRRIRAGASAGP